MTSLFPREEHAEALFHRILSNPGAEQQLYETFCMEQENASFEDGGGAECSFAKALLQAYENRDISALTIALCNNTMFDLLRTAYLIPYRFHGKNGGNPRLLTDANGEVREEYRNAVHLLEMVQDVMLKLLKRQQNAQLIVIFLQLAAGVLTVEYHRCRAPLLDFIFDLNRT